MLDVAIIGCGIVGANVAFLLSQYPLNVVVLEKENDVSMGTTRANSAIIHAGYDPEPGTLMARLNVKGSAATKEQCVALDVPYRQIGSMVLAFTKAELQTVAKLCANGIANGVPGVRVLTKEETLAMEPSLSADVLGALYAPSAAIAEPWELCLALTECAVKNGVDLQLETAVLGIKPIDGGYRVHTNQGDFDAKTVVNAAGVDSDVVASMVSKAGFVTKASRGEYYLLDKAQGTLVNHIIFQCPNEVGKGVLVAPTVHGNLIVGPNAKPGEREDTATTLEGLDFVRKMAVKSVPSINFRENIRNFAGVRANTDQSDFVIAEQAAGFVTLGGIKSPGLSSALEIAAQALLLLENTLGFTEKGKKEHCITTRKRVRFNTLSQAEKAALVQKDARYGRVICRCETITEGEILEALHSAVPARTIDGVKRRCNAGMGRCQGGFCGPRVHELIARERNIPMESVCKDKTGSTLLTGRTKGDTEND